MKSQSVCQLLVFFLLMCAAMTGCAERLVLAAENLQVSIDSTQLTDPISTSVNALFKEKLARCGDSQAVALIEPLLDGPQHHRAAAAALSEIATPAALKAIKSRLLAQDYPYAQAVAMQMAEASRLASAQAFSPLPAVSQQSGDELHRVVSLASLFRDVLNSPTSSVRNTASIFFRETTAGIKRKLAEPGVVDALVKAASDEDAGTRATAVSPLAHSQAPEAKQAVIKALTDTDARVRVAAAIAAGSHRSEAIVDSLIKLLGDADGGVVIAACGSLGMLRAEKAADRIRELQSAEDSRLAAVAIDALKAMAALTEHEAARAKLGIAHLSQDELDVLARAKDRTVVPKLITVLQSTQKEQQFRYANQLAEVLGKIGDPQAVEALLEVLNQRSAPPQDYSTKQPLYGSELPLALGKLGDKRSIKPLEEAMAKAGQRTSMVPISTRRSQRYSFLVALSLLEAPGIADRVAEEIKGNKGYEVALLLETLGLAGSPPVVPMIEPFLDDPRHHRIAASALLQINTPAALAPIKTRLLQQDFEYASAVLSQFTRRQIPESMKPEQVQENLKQPLALLREIANSPNAAVREIGPRIIAVLEERLLVERFKVLQAHILSEDFDTADSVFRDFVAKELTAIGDDPSQARRIVRWFGIIQSGYTQAEQTDRAKKHYVWLCCAIEDIAGKPDAPDLNGLSLELRLIRVVSALRANTEVDDRQIRQLIDDIESLLADRASDGLTTWDLAMGASLAQALHRTEHIELAVETYQLLARVAGQSEDEKLTRMGANYAITARRLNLPGNKTK